MEPYLMVGAVDPDTDLRDDVASEIALACNVGTWNRLRLGVEAQSARFGRHTSRALGLLPWRFFYPIERGALILQLGAEF